MERAMHAAGAFWSRTAARVAAALAVLAAAVLAAAALWPAPAGERHVRAEPREPGRIEVTQPAGGLGTAVAAFGDLWLDDRAANRLLRVRVDENRVVARIPVRGRISLAAGAGGVWALDASRRRGALVRGLVLHIDPRDNRVLATIPLATRLGEPLVGLGLLAHDRRVWAWGPRDVLRIDPRTDKVVQSIRIATEVHGNIAGLALRRGRLIVATADGTFLRLDPRTGALRGAVRTQFDFPAIRATAGNTLIVASEGELAALDPLSGRVAWRRALGYRVGAVTRAHGLLWVASAALDEPGDRLSGLDPVTGKRATTSLLPVFTATGLATVGARLFVPSSNGSLVAVSPLIL